MFPNSDKYYIQGGFISYGSGWRTVTLHKKYTNDSYCVSGGIHQIDSSYTSNPLSFCSKAKTASNFSAGGHDDTTLNSCSFTWQTAGYLP